LPESTLAVRSWPIPANTKFELRRTKLDDNSYLMARYGDYLLYKPPVQGNTTLLWFGPFALLLAGAGVWFILSRRRDSAATRAISAEDEAKAKSMLDNG
jgi:cytochrome c-type biogenesis protein CcmH